MNAHPSHWRRRAAVLAIGIAGAASIGILAFDQRVGAESDPAAEAPAKVAKRKRHVEQKAASEIRETPSAAEAKNEPAAPVARSNVEKAPYDFAAQLERAGASACRAQLNALALSTMGGVEAFNTVSSWSQEAGDKRAVSIAIGQKFADAGSVPYGAAQIVASPNQQGSCDGLSVQVVPSPLSCGKLKDSMTARNSRPIGDLAGIPVLEDASGRTMLVPTKADTCVLIATRTFYGKSGIK